MVDGPNPVMFKKDGKWVEEQRKEYVILLDNGRLKAAKDPVMKQAFQCIRCCSCLNVCPIWTLVGGNVYGHIYSGGIGAILTGLLGKDGLKAFAQFSDLCIGCRKCTTVCPGKIPIPDLIDELRSRQVKANGLALPEKTVFQNILANRKIFHTLLRIGAKAQKPVQSGRFIRHLPLFFAGMTKGRSLPAIAAAPFRDRVAKLLQHNPAQPVMKVGFFSGCNLDFVFPQTSENVVKVLQDAGAAVVFPPEQSCCGKPAIGLGDRDTGRKIALQNIAAFEKEDVDVIVCACPTCTETLTTTYQTLFRDDPAQLDRVKAFSCKVREFTSLVAGLYEKQGRLAPQPGKEKITYHDSCHMKRGLGIYKEPRALLDSIKGVQFVEMDRCDKCCGMAGAFGVKYKEISMPLLDEKIDNIKNTGAKTVAVACPACMMQIGGGLDQKAPAIHVHHIADILAAHIGQK
jgi:Fe-S oxidoreductase